MPTSSQVSTRLTADNSDYRSVMNQSVGIAEKTGKGIFKGLDLRNAMGSVAIAIGMSVQVIAEKVARAWAGVSDAQEASWKNVERLSTEIADKEIEVARAKVSDETRYQLLLQDQEKLRRRIAANVYSAVEEQEKKLLDRQELLKKEAEAETLLAKIQKDKADKLEKNLENEKNLREQLAEIKRAAADEGDRRALEIEQELFDFAQQHREELELQAKIKTGTITPEEQKRLEIIRLQNKAAQTQVELGYLLAKPQAQWTQADKEHFSALERQNKGLQEQIALLSKVADSTAAVTEVVQAVDSSWGSAVGKLKSFVEEWTGWKQEIGAVGRGNRELSDRELQRKLDSINADLASRMGNSGYQGAAGSNYDLLGEAQRSQQAQVRAELDFRDSVRRSVSAFGENAAFNQFPGLTEERFKQILSGMGPTENARLVSTLDKLNRRLDQPLQVIPLSTPPPPIG